MLRARLVVNTRTVGQNRAAAGQSSLNIGTIETRVARTVQMNPKQVFAFFRVLSSSCSGVKSLLHQIVNLLLFTDSPSDYFLRLKASAAFKVAFPARQRILKAD